MYINNWNPEDNLAWNSYAKKIAYRNLIISTLCLTLSFVVWVYWSILTVKINEFGFNFSNTQLFTLLAVPGIVGAFSRIINSFVIPVFGGRRWTMISTSLLLVPSIGITLALQNPNTEYNTFLIFAVCCGISGGNFSSSMANISLFFPKRLQGSALGVNGGIGNLGVSLFQLVSPYIVVLPVFGKINNGIYLSSVIAVWVPIILIALILTSQMSSVKTELRAIQQLVVFKRLNMYLTIFLYTCAFGTFIGCSVAFPLLAKLEYNDVNFMKFVFIGPLLGSVARVIGGIISDKIGAAKVSMVTFIGMIVSSILIILSVNYGFVSYLISFQLLFIFSGIANGSIFALIGKIFILQEKGPAIAFSAAIAAFGAFLVPKLLNWSVSTYHSSAAAFIIFGILYILALMVLAVFYRKID